MTSASNQLILTDANLIGAGAHKITYTSPDKKNLRLNILQLSVQSNIGKDL